jgi:hypothetical protein
LTRNHLHTLFSFPFLQFSRSQQLREASRAQLLEIRLRDAAIGSSLLRSPKFNRSPNSNTALPKRHDLTSDYDPVAAKVLDFSKLSVRPQSAGRGGDAYSGRGGGAAREW